MMSPLFALVTSLSDKALALPEPVLLLGWGVVLIGLSIAVRSQPVRSIPSSSRPAGSRRRDPLRSSSWVTQTHG